MTVLVTGADGMIGSELVKALQDEGYTVIGVDKIEKVNCLQVDLGEKECIKEIILKKSIDRVIHLAALAHTEGESDLSWNRYYHVNVECSRNVFESVGNTPVLFISTIDVYGFYDGKEKVTAESRISPVSSYAKSKAIAEEECKKIPHYSIFRFSPVYTDTVKRDIQKRYYIKYPTIAYQIGNGTYYEVLNIKHAVAEMVAWCSEKPQNDIRIIKDDVPMCTSDCIKAEKAVGRANTVLRIPRWMVICGYIILRAILGKNEKTYLLNKAVHPLKTEI